MLRCSVPSMPIISRVPAPSPAFPRCHAARCCDNMSRVRGCDSFVPLDARHFLGFAMLPCGVEREESDSDGGGKRTTPYYPRVARSRWLCARSSSSPRMSLAMFARPSPSGNSKNLFRTFKSLSLSEFAIGASAYHSLRRRCVTSSIRLGRTSWMSCLRRLRRMNGVDFVLVLLLKDVGIIHGRVAAMGALQALDVNAVF
jgi:hypothetical protein